MMDQHVEKWSEYQDLPDAKLTYFDVAMPYIETVCAYFGQRDKQILETISAPIVDYVINGLLAETGEDNNDDKLNFLKYDNNSGN